MTFKNVLFLSLVFLFFSCQHGETDKVSLGGMKEEAMAASEAIDQQPTPKRKKQPALTKNTEQPTEFQKKIIKTAQINLEVENYNTSIIDLKKLLGSYQAEIYRESERNTPYALENNLVIKVIPPEFDALVADVTKLGLNVLRKDISSNDVSEEYYDIKTRLESKRAVLKRYKDILRSAKTIKDILSVEDKIRVVTEEIESAEGRLRYLNAQVGMSTINLKIHQDIEQPDIITKKKSFLQKLAKSFGNGFEILTNLILALVTFWPFFLLIPLFIWAYKRFWKR